MLLSACGQLGGLSIISTYSTCEFITFGWQAVFSLMIKTFSH
jgi:hypothetical protein